MHQSQKEVLKSIILKLYLASENYTLYNHPLILKKNFFFWFLVRNEVAYVVLAKLSHLGLGFDIALYLQEGEAPGIAVAVTI